MHCIRCSFKNTSKLEIVTVGRWTPRICRTNTLLTHLSVVDDTGVAGVRRMLGVLGMSPIAKFQYYKHLRHLFSNMKKHYNCRQTIIHIAIRKHLWGVNDADEDGILKVDVSFDGTWMKRGHTSKIGMNIIIEVYTDFVIYYELLSKYNKPFI